MESIVLAVIIPFLLILGWRFISLRLPILLLGALLILKIVLFLGSPAGGWLVKVHPPLTQELSYLYSSLNIALTGQYHSDQRHEGDAWVNTYATSWNENASGILLQPWTEKLDFPLDWALFPMSAECGVSTLPCYNKLNPVIEIEGALFLPEGKRFALVAQGVQKGTLSAIHESGESFILTPAKDVKEAAEKQYQLPRSGRWRVFGKLHYGGTEWSLIPTLVAADGEIGTELGRGVLWQSEESLSSAEGQIGIYKFISFVIDIGIIVFLVVWAAWVSRLMIHRQVLNLPLAICSVTAICISIFMAPIFEYILTMLGLPDPTTASYLGFSITAVATGFLVWVYCAKDFRNFEADRIVSSVFLFFGPVLLFFFAHKWWSILGHWAIWGAGDDWTSYQYLARKIVIEGEWLYGGEDTAGRMQPLYRYFVGIYHWLFGQSAFVQHMADVWCVLGATTLLTSWAMKLRLSTPIVFIVIIAYLMSALVSAHRYHIGRGLIEHHAMIFMVLAGWLLYGAREGNFLRIIAAGICGVIGYWLRQDHLVVIVMLVFLIIEPTHGTTKEVWKSYWSQIWTYWRRGFSYVGILAFGVILEGFRHWWVCGVFGPTCMVGNSDINVLHFNITSYIHWNNIYHVLTMSHWPAIPQVSTSILLTGFVLGVLALVWRPGFLRTYPASLGLVFIGYLLPYFFLNIWSYPPRYSIHLLPIATLSVMIVLESLCNSSKFGKNFLGRSSD